MSTDRKNNVLLIWPERDKGFYHFDPVGLIFGQKTLFFPLPLIYVASALGDEWNFTLVDEGIAPLEEHQIRSADFFMISVNILQRFATEKLIDRLLPFKKPIIVGGPLISTLDHLFRQPGVSKVYGEIEAVEATCLENGTIIADLLAHDMKNGTIKPEYRSKGHPDLTTLKPPRYDLVKKSDYFALSMQTSRGCPHGCDFCQQIALYGRHRRKNTRQVKIELDMLLKLGQNITVVITDDNLLGDISTPEKKQELLDLLHLIHTWQKEHNYPFDFFMQCSLDIAEHTDIVELMSKIGLNIMFIGIESIDNAALASVHKKQNLEKNMIAQIRILQKYGMGIFAGIIVGFDNESEESIDKQISFIKNSYIPVVAPTIMMGLAGTKMYKRLLQENRISSDPDALTRALWTNVIPTMHPRKLYSYFLRFLHEVYEPKEYFSRCFKWIDTWNDAYVIPGKKGSLPTNVKIGRMLRSFYYQGILAPYRIHYYGYILKTFIRYWNNYNRLALALYLGYLFQMPYMSTKNAEKFVKNLPRPIVDEWELKHRTDDAAAAEQPK